MENLSILSEIAWMPTGQLFLNHGEKFGDIITSDKVLTAI
jgi:hypothetical protein